MRVAVLGAGVAGLVAGYELGRHGHTAEVYERWPGLGGQAATIDVGDGHLLERYYHHLFQTDRHIRSLYDELGLSGELEWHRSTVAMFTEGQSHAFTSPLDLLRYRPLSLPSRLRMGAVVLGLQRLTRSVDRFEGVTARAWIERYMGREVYTRVWGPLLSAKFGERADAISMGWLWSKLTLRRELRGSDAREERLGYPQGSWERLFVALRERIESAGGRVMLDRPAARLELEPAGRPDRGLLVHAGVPGAFRQGHDPRAYARLPESERFDAVLATVPSDVFVDLLSDELKHALGPEYLGRVGAAEYQTALCLLLEVDRRVSDYYWTNVLDPQVPFIGLVEHTNLVDTGRYNGRRFLYIANYLPAGDPLLELAPEALLEAYLPGLQAINADFSLAWVRSSWVFSEPAAQPIVPLGYRARIPPLQTPVRGLVLANTTQIYPEDRGTNYSVRLGRDAVAELLGSMPGS